MTVRLQKTEKRNGLTEVYMRYLRNECILAHGYLTGHIFQKGGDHFCGVDIRDTKEISIYRKFINLKITMDLQNPLYLLPAFNTAFSFSK